jgi:hypothetical protein
LAGRFIVSLDPQVIAGIRLRRQLQELRAALKVSEAVAEQMLSLSGILERGIDPRQVQVKPEELPALLELARKIEAEEAMLDVSGRPPASGRVEV